MARTASAAAPAAAQTELLDVAIPPAARHPKVRMITRSEIFPDPEQPRQAADAELRNSLARNGMLQPITVRRHPTQLAAWMIVDGERRWRSAEGVLNDLPCVVRDDMDELPRRLATQLEANTGKPLSPLEEARAFGKLIEETGASIADLAAMLGRAPSTVAERVALLELGPWLPLIESGEIVMSHAVKVLLPLRTVPDDVHEQVIPKVRADYRWGKKGGGSGISLGDFQSLVETYYRPAMYPLAKTKGYGKQPEFNTSKHDAECGCGGIKFDLGGGSSARLCCGNPAWWRPRHRAALKAKKAAAPKEAAKGGKALYLPAGTPTLKSEWGDAPAGVVQLTDSSGQWRIDPDRPFDPADLPLAKIALVQWAPRYGVGYPYVGTTDIAAVEAARKHFGEMLDEGVHEQRVTFAEDLDRHRESYRISGPGCTQLLSLVDFEGVVHEVHDISVALGLGLPPGCDVRDVTRWAEGLEEPQASRLFTALATAMGEELDGPSRARRRLQTNVIEKIRKRPIPWKTKPKAEKKPAPAKKGKKPAKETPAAQFMKPMYPSAALAAVVGLRAQPRVDVTKSLWKYIKKHGLQDTKNRRMINTDDTLRAIFGGKDAVSMFEMTKLINKHLAGTAEAAALIYTSGKKKAKKAGAGLPLSKLSAETAELPLDADPLATFRDEEAELTLADERAAEGAFDEDDEDDAALWDSPADDELEEAEA